MGEARTQRLSTVEPHTDHAQAPEERRQLKTELDEVQRGFKIVYRYCLYALILLVTGFAVVLFTAIADTDDVNSAFLHLYGGVAFLAVLFWGISKPSGLRATTADRPELRALLGSHSDRVV